RTNSRNKPNSVAVVFHLPAMALTSKSGEKPVGLSPKSLQVAVHAERPGGGLFRRGWEHAEEQVRYARTRVRVVAGVALHRAIEQRHVALTIDRVGGSRYPHADVRRRSGIRVHEVDRVLPGQVAYRFVVRHEIGALRQRLVISTTDHLVPRIDGHRAVMAA